VRPPDDRDRRHPVPSPRRAAAHGAGPAWTAAFEILCFTAATFLLTALAGW
jgi:hypothetical protein